MARTRFFGSQVGGRVVTPHSYTGSPLQLLKEDVKNAFCFYQFLPFIVWPIRPSRSGDLCELYPSVANLLDMFLHFILVLMQIPFLIFLALTPLWMWFFPLGPVVVGIVIFWTINQGICFILNGSKLQYASDPKLTPRSKEFENEQWIFLNGVAVGSHWLESNVNRLALTFGRPVLGVHNKTNGILFDVIECLIQRNFNFATEDIRSCYKVVKETLYQPHLTKVVFILHSQGGIEGGMIIDWLLQEVPQDLLAKLEVYTFGNAANHFNNPHIHLLSQHASLSNPTLPSITKTSTQVHYHDPLANAENGRPISKPQALNTTKSSQQSSASGKTLRYIEHYAHTSDFVARWGVLHFTCNFSLSATAPRFMGRVFERQGGGHQFNQHYLDNMFPLKKAADGKGGIGNSGFVGAEEDKNEFMNSVMELGVDKDEAHDEREGFEMSYYGTHGEPLSDGETEVLLRDMSPVTPTGVTNAMKEFQAGKGFTNSVNENESKMEFRVKHLSRLWLYRNGKSPKLDEVDAGIKRMATF